MSRIFRSWHQRHRTTVTRLLMTYVQSPKVTSKFFLTSGSCKENRDMVFVVLTLHWSHLPAGYSMTSDMNDLRFFNLLYLNRIESPKKLTRKRSNGRFSPNIANYGQFFFLHFWPKCPFFDNSRSNFFLIFDLKWSKNWRFDQKFRDLVSFLQFSARTAHLIFS